MAADQDTTEVLSGWLWLQGLPLRVVTMAQKRHKAALEQRVEELEEAITIFSKPKVLVEIEDAAAQEMQPGRATM